MDRPKWTTLTRCKRRTGSAISWAASCARTPYLYHRPATFGENAAELLRQLTFGREEGLGSDRREVAEERVVVCRDVLLFYGLGFSTTKVLNPNQGSDPPTRLRNIPHKPRIYNIRITPNVNSQRRNDAELVPRNTSPRGGLQKLNPPPNSRVVRDQICTTYGPKIKCVEAS